MSEEVIAQTTSNITSNASSGILWIETKQNCSVSHEGSGISQSEITFTQSGKTWTIPIGYNFDITGCWTKTYSNVDIDCELGGTFQCTANTCADFWASLN